MIVTRMTMTVDNVYSQDFTQRNINRVFCTKVNRFKGLTDFPTKYKRRLGLKDADKIVGDRRRPATAKERKYERKMQRGSPLYFLQRRLSLFLLP